MTPHRLSAACWLLAAPLFLAANVVTGRAWRHPPFSWATHNISDLGNVTCGIWDTTRPRPVCSPWHAVMNASMMTTGALLVLGAGLAWTAFGRGAAARTAQFLTIAAGSGYLLAAAYPADVNENAHVLGAMLIFALGNVAMLVAALARRSPLLGPMRPLSLALGLTGVAGAVLFLAQVDLGFGVGGMERVAMFPLFGWTVALGARLLRTSVRTGDRSSPEPARGPARPR